MDDSTGAHRVDHYTCVVCGAGWDSRQLIRVPLLTSVALACGDPGCGGDVVPSGAAAVASPAPGPHGRPWPVRPSGPGVWQRRASQEP